jgi:hemerythrin-like domain-containing protein
VLRNPNLIALSRQHHRALALCVRIDRALKAGDLDMLAWQAEIQQIFVEEIQNHFEAEERALFPVALGFAELGRLVDELLGEHALLRDYFALASETTMDPAKLHDFSRKLATHIRKEERELFEGLQKLLAKEEMAILGKAIAEALDEGGRDRSSCALPNQATRLRSLGEIEGGKARASRRR